MRFTLTLVFFLTGMTISSLRATDPANPFQTLDLNHPRLLMSGSEWNALRERVEAGDPAVTFLWSHVRDVADACLTQEPVVRELEGRRLLGVSRLALKRIAFLAMTWRLTGDARYLDRAVAEMDAIATFSDWNPSHFLDVAEMAAGMGIGYDWLHQALSETQRARYRGALLDKALSIGFRTEEQGNWWIDGTNNWNQVCNGGLSMAALAIAGEGGGDVPVRIVRQAIANVGHAMQEYEPDGGYPEGAGYWDYGTTYNVLFLAVLQSALGSDFGVADPYPGFRQTADFRAQMNTPAGLRYNFGDNSTPQTASPTLFWFNHPQVNRMEFDSMRQTVPSFEPNARSQSGRMIPFQLIWLSRADLDGAGPMLPLAAAWRGKNPVAIFRTSWSDPDASLVTLKGGKARISHGHMDAGSFIYEANGVRWALDLPRGGYHHFESQGVGLWDMAQDGDRWTLKAWSTLGHNLLRFPGFNPDVDGGCDWLEQDLDASVISVDLTNLYPQFYDTHHRAVELHEDGSARVIDMITGLLAPVNPQWTLLTPAEIVTDATGATLTLDGKTLRVNADCAQKLRVFWESAAEPLRPEDVPYPGVKRLIIEPQMTTGEFELTVSLIPVD